MNNNYYSTESNYTPGNVYDSPVMEDYNPDEYSNQPYQPQTPYYQQPQQQPNYQYNQQSIQQINQAQVAQQQNAKPTYESANENLRKYDEMLGKINHMTRNNQNIGFETDENYAIGVAIEALHNAVNTLNSVNQWIPQGRESLAPRLSAAGAPIRDALIPYIKALRSII